MNSYEVEVDLGGGEWLSRTAEEALRVGKEGIFRRFFRGRIIKWWLTVARIRLDAF